MVGANWRREIEEGQHLEREYALQRVAALVKQYNFSIAEIFSLMPVTPQHEMHGPEGTASRTFDPFFDAW